MNRMSINYTISALNATITPFSSMTENASLRNISLKIASLIFLFVVSLAGNILIIWVICKDKRLRTNTNILVANMAVSDLLFPLVSVPYNVTNIIFNHRWFIGGDLGVALCKIVHFVGEISFLISIYSCIFIALDRYYAVAQPFKGGFSRSRLKYILPGIWIFSGIVTSPFLRISRLKKYNNDSFSCVLDWSQDGIPRGHQIHAISVTILANGLPIPIIIILYSLIFYKLCKQKLLGEQPTDFFRKVRERQNKKVLMMSVTIVSFLFFSRLSFDLYYFLEISGQLKSLSYFIISDINFAASYILHLSFAYNFFVYLAFNDSYRENFSAILSKCCCSCLAFYRRRITDVYQVNQAGLQNHNQNQFLALQIRAGAD